MTINRTDFPAIKDGLSLSTYTMWSQFRNCRRYVDWRYHHQLVPRDRIPAQRFGSTMHQCVATWYAKHDFAAVETEILRAYPNLASDHDQREDYNVAIAMMRGYVQRYPEEPFEVISVERPFCQPIINPSTGRESRSFAVAGKVDALVRSDGALWLLEHKTASSIDEGYIERLWGDFQSVLYAHYVSCEVQEPVVGVIYNALLKSRLRQSQGETEEEYKQRAADLAKKNKSGTTTAQRRVAEGDEEFQARLAEKYAEPGAYVRVPLYLSADQTATLQEELWELTQAYLEARRRGIWYQNTDYCWHYNRPCAYWRLCRSGGNEIVRDNDYEHREPFEELRCESEVPF